MCRERIFRHIFVRFYKYAANLIVFILTITKSLVIFGERSIMYIIFASHLGVQNHE